MRQENSQLKKEVGLWKEKLIAAEKASGIEQVAASTIAVVEQQQPKSEGNLKKIQMKKVKNKIKGIFICKPIIFQSEHLNK